MVAARLRAGDGLTQPGVFLLRGVEFAHPRRQFGAKALARQSATQFLTFGRKRLERPHARPEVHDVSLRFLQAPVVIGDLGRQPARDLASGALGFGDGAGVAAVRGAAHMGHHVNFAIEPRFDTERQMGMRDQSPIGARREARFDGVVPIAQEGVLALHRSALSQRAFKLHVQMFGHRARHGNCPCSSGYDHAMDVIVR